MNFPIVSQALIYKSYGKPHDVLELGSNTIEELAPNEVLLKTLAAPINPADMGKLGGSYGSLEELPAVGGLEGVAEIVAVGSYCKSWKIGDRVFIPDGLGSWQSYAAVHSSKLFKAPQDLSLEQAAMAWVNPATAWKLLHDFADLKPGDWIIQNAATSAVGKLVIQIAKAKEIKTINLIRDAKRSEQLKSLGADIVLEDNKDAAKEVLAQLGSPIAKLALNSVGAVSSYSMIKALADHSSLVTFGAMDRELAPFPTRYLIFNDIRLRGFWVSKFYKETSRETIEELHDKLYSFMSEHKISVEVGQSYSLSQFRDAIAHANKTGKTGKVLFKPNL
ncbi:2-enoyl thioester reductase domain-containing protein [Puniceicoccaceae bacterium K14]|nr:2-enoyl thioester reductase domain-containing protein [Puniceicoccaceae bacterium K14]